MKYYIEFKTKPFELFDVDDETTVKAVKMPEEIQPHHISRDAKALMLSQQFEKQIGNICYREVIGQYTQQIFLNDPLDNVEIDDSKFLAVVRVNIENTKHISRKLNN